MFFFIPLFFFFYFFFLFLPSFLVWYLAPRRVQAEHGVEVAGIRAVHGVDPGLLRPGRCVKDALKHEKHPSAVARQAMHIVVLLPVAFYFLVYFFEARRVREQKKKKKKKKRKT
jgi:hypothetical protein